MMYVAAYPGRNVKYKMKMFVTAVCFLFLLIYSYFSRCHVTTNSVASSIRSDEELTLETSAFKISVRWPIYIINSVDKTKFLYTTSPPTQNHSYFRNYPLHSSVIGHFADIV